MTQVDVLCQEHFIYPGNIKTLRDPSGRANCILVVMFKEATMTDTNLGDVTFFLHGRLTASSPLVSFLGFGFFFSLLWSLHFLYVDL